MNRADPAPTVAFCGLLCDECGCVCMWECEGCKAGRDSRRCRVRECATSRGFTTCAECPEMESCPHLNSLANRLYDLMFRTGRDDNLQQIRTLGLLAFAARRTRAREP